MSEPAIIVNNLYKNFRIYHERRDSAYEVLIGTFRRKKYYEDLEVLRGVSFEVKKGEMFGIIGKNGAGKTTLLRIISGIYKPDKGNVQVSGLLTPLLSLGIGFQQDLTAKSNIIQYGILLGFNKSEIQKKIDAILEYAELEKFADTKLKNFSTGMYTRLAFSTAMQVEPDIVIIDEALYAGDMSFQKKAIESIMSFKKRGKTIVAVSHSMQPIQDNCNRAMLLLNGKVGAIGHPEEVISEYKKSIHIM